MRPLRKLGVVLSFSLLMPLAVQAASLTELTKALEPQLGFIEVWRDAARGRVLLSLSSAQLGQPFLLLSSLPFGLGSNDVGLDRGQPGENRLVHFEKRGAKLLLVQENTRFRASASNPAERASVVEAFASSVLWSGEILASEEGPGGKHLVDFSSFLLADRHGVINRLRDSKQGAYRVDDKRSAVLVENSKAFPTNVELEALLTFDGAGEGGFVRDVAMEAASLSLRQHISLIKLPEPGFQPRPYHPASGGIDIAHADFSTPLASSLNVAWQIRHRLEKTDPTARLSPVKKPIVYYLDRGTPEPVRSALLDGARWWATAFEKAGFKDAYRVEMLPEGADPMDARYNVIQWVHRATRGWSYGAPITDPRTGEIIKGVVMLGSQRVRQDILIAESLLAAYAKGGEARQKQALEMALARLRQLSAHEVGHTLGFSHNFAASRAGNGSVMDYPHPLVKLDAAGEVDLREAYGVGLGPWDDFIVQHAYGQFGSSAEEATALARLRGQARAQGLLYVGDSDSRSPGSQHPDGVLWDFGADSIKTWDQVMAVREHALRRFSVDVLPPERQLGELEARLVPVYLLHRYQGEALAHLLGGADFEYGLAGDARSGAVRAGTRPVPAAVQRQALARLVGTLRAESLALPAALLDQLTPPAEGYERGREYFVNRMATQFDPLAAAQAAASHFGGLLMNAERLNRLAWQHGRDAAQPGVGEVLDQLLKSTWQREVQPKGSAGAAAVQTAVNWVVVDGLLGLLDSGRLHAGADAELRQRLRELAQWLHKQPSEANRKEAAALIQAYLANPQSVKLRRLPPVPQGAPI